MKTVEEILEQINAEIEYELKQKIHGLESKKPDVADKAVIRAALLEQLRDFITDTAASETGEGGKS